MTSAAVPSLTGFTVAITASRRVDEFATMLRRRGADVVAAAAIHMVPLADDARLRAATEDVIATPPDVLIATTGIGFRGWMAAAGSWGLAEQLLDALRGARVISRGPRPPVRCGQPGCARSGRRHPSRRTRCSRT